MNNKKTMPSQRGQNYLLMQTQLVIISNVYSKQSILNSYYAYSIIYLKTFYKFCIVYST